MPEPHMLDPAQLVDTGPARRVDDIVAKLFLRAWEGRTAPQPLGRMLMVSTPEAAADLLARPGDFTKHYGFLTQLGRSRLDTDGADWERRRDLTQPLYREAARALHRPVIDAVYGRWLTDHAVQSGEIGRALLAAAAEVFVRALGGEGETGPIADWLISLRQTAILAQHVAMFDPSARQLARLQQDVADLRQALRDMLRQDARLMAALHDRVAALDSEIDLLGEITINLFAGAETTVASICWALNLLARQPDLQDRLAAALLTEGPAAPMLEHVIQEVMRFCPPVPLLVRTAAATGLTLAGMPVRPGQRIALSIVGLHHNPAHWIDPARFDGARAAFADNTWNRRAYLPFSAGARVCGGLGLARAEVASALSRILMTYRIAPRTDPIAYEFSLTLRPLGTSQLHFIPRDSREAG